MGMSDDSNEKKTGKKLYDYQHDAIEQIFKKFNSFPENHNLLYQLPTGGGKTVIFAEIAKRYIAETKKKVLILTHRIELCNQTSSLLSEIGVKNMIINSKVKTLPNDNDYKCFVAMVETLNNRLQDQVMDMQNVGLVIIDEAHYNSFRKLFDYFGKSIVLGVTATPLSSNIKLPMKHLYHELIVGHSIAGLIKKGFLAEAETYSYDVSLSTLKVGINGDYTVKSSELLYSNFTMLDKLLYAYEHKSKGKKTLIFNNGINTSKHVHLLFEKAGYNVRHLDNTHKEDERRDILHWFKVTPDAILTSVGILTTGFDEPTIETIILNRATKSLTLYHQMIGRGSRIIKNKKKFDVIDLGNNALRFGMWDAPMNWHDIFKSPDFYLENITSDDEIERNFKYKMPDEIRSKFPKSEDLDLDIEEEYTKAQLAGKRPKAVLDKSLEQHVQMCLDNSEDVFEARSLANLLDEDIENRAKRYAYCLTKSTKNYIKWLQDDYKRQLVSMVTRKYIQIEAEKQYS
jgi:superfamily II DNA or RNA helicase